MKGASARPKTRNRLLLYAAIALLSEIGTGITVAMFGDGSLSWAEFRFLWTALGIKAALSVGLTVRAFIDRTSAEESAEARAGL